MFYFFYFKAANSVPVDLQVAAVAKKRALFFIPFSIAVVLACYTY